MINIFKAITPDQTYDAAAKPMLPTGYRSRIGAYQQRRRDSA